MCGAERDSSLAQGMATNFGMLLAAVMIAAVGGSVHLTMSVSLVSDLLPPNRVRYCLSLIMQRAALASTVLMTVLCYSCPPPGRYQKCGLQISAHTAVQFSGMADPSYELSSSCPKGFFATTWLRLSSSQPHIQGRVSALGCGRHAQDTSHQLVGCTAGAYL